MVKENTVNLRYSIYSPSLGYHFPFLHAGFLVSSSYPVRIIVDGMQDIEANNEEELTASLKKIFNAPSTVETIEKILSLTQE